MTGKWRRVVTWDDKQLRLLMGLCRSPIGVITVTSEYGTRRTRSAEWRLSIWRGSCFASWPPTSGPPREADVLALRQLTLGSESSA